jgi:predicted AAA+ superfamily ATPase
MEIRELLKFNEWWETGKVSEKNIEKYKRYLFYKIQKFVEDRQIILITGLRRVGKTTLMYQLIHDLLEKGVESKKILYFSFDEEIFDLKDVLETYKREILRKDFKDAGRIYVFFDEIQKVNDWENKIKVYYDLNPNIKFFLSGSASLILSKKAKESLAGRVYEFLLKPLTFKEFLEMKGVKLSFEDAKLLNDKILPYFTDFLIKSGFPEIIEEEDEEKIRAYIKLSVIDRIIYKDIPTQFGRTDIDLLEKLINLFLKNPGSILNLENLARDLRRDKKTLMNYIYYLKFSLLINFVSNFRISIRATSRKNRKIYPATTSFIFSLYGRFDDQILGKVLETIFCSEVGANYYFKKGNKEIDFLIIKNDEIVPVEIKYKISRNEIKAYSSLLKKMHLNKGIVLSMDIFQEYFENNVKILVFPVWTFLVFTEEILKKFDSV